MNPKRVFKTKTFSRWTRNLVPDADLWAAAREIEQGLFEADLGKGLCKKRIAVRGRGKSGAVRTLVAKRHPAAIVFLFGRQKSEPGDDFPDAVVEAAKIIAVRLQRSGIEVLERLIAAGELKEICDVAKND